MTSWWEKEPRPLRRIGDLERLAADLTDWERSPRFHAGAAEWSLDGMRVLHRRLGRPLERRPVVHVAGSKGKGSVCLVLEALLRAQGLATGVYLSPHVDRWNERLRLRGRDIGTAPFLAAVAEVLAVARAGHLARPTFFETLTAAAFAEFERREVDVAVIETGIGGRLDCTNVVASDVTLVTAIEREHRAVLGHTLSGIAREKAGIFKPGVPAISGLAGSSTAATVLGREARRVGAPFTAWGRDFRVRVVGDRFRLECRGGPLLTLPVPAGGPFAGRNAALAVVALWRLAGRRPELGLRLEEEPLAAGLGAVELKGRCERWPGPPDVYRDGSHTPRSLAGTCRWVRRRAAGPLVLVLGLNQDKDHKACLRAVRDTVGLLIATAVPGGRGRDPADLLREARRLGIPAAAVAAPSAALAAARRRAGRRGSILVAGSFWLAGSLLPDLRERA